VKKPRKQKQTTTEPEEAQQQADSAEVAAEKRLAEARVSARKARFLFQFRKLKVVAFAAKRIGIDRRTVYKWTATDPEFKDELQNAQEEIVDALERELHKLATGQYKRPLVSAGKLVAFEEIHSETALMALLKAYRPKLYRERTGLEITGGTTSRVEITKKEVSVQLVADVTKLLVESGLGSNDPASLADAARRSAEPVDSALAVAKASRLSLPPA